MEWITRINWADAVAIIIILRGTYVGSQRGIFGELFYIFAIWLALVFGIHLYSLWGDFLNKYLFIPLNIGNLLGFLIITCGIYLISKLIYSLFPRQKIIKIEILPRINRIGGTVLGFCRGFAIAIVIFLIMLLIPIRYIIESAKTRSFLAPFFMDAGSMVYKKTLSIFSSIESKNLNELLTGAKPLKFDRFKLKRKDRLDEILE